MNKPTQTCVICNSKKGLVEFKGQHICKNCIDHVKAEA